MYVICVINGCVPRLVILIPYPLAYAYWYLSRAQIYHKGEVYTDGFLLTIPSWGFQHSLGSEHTSSLNSLSPLPGPCACWLPVMLVHLLLKSLYLGTWVASLACSSTQWSGKRGVPDFALVHVHADLRFQHYGIWLWGADLAAWSTDKIALLLLAKRHCWHNQSFCMTSAFFYQARSSAWFQSECLKLLQYRKYFSWGMNLKRIPLPAEQEQCVHLC